MEAAGIIHIAYPSRRSRITVWNLSDIHWGSAACSVKSLRADVQTIRRDPGAFFFLGGDQCDLISPGDKRWNPGELSDKIKVTDLKNYGKYLFDELLAELAPIKEKCLGAVFGNHEDAYQLKTETDLHSYFCTAYGCRNLGWCSFVDLSFKRRTCKRPILLRQVSGGGHGDGCRIRVFISHGSGSAVTPGGKLNRLIQIFNNFEADLYFCGHVHDRISRRQEMLGCNDSCSKLTGRDKLGVVSGSYLTTYSQGHTTYGEKRGYAPTTLGAAKVTILPQTGEMWGEV